MVQHWRVAKAEAKKQAEDEDVAELMHWLCGTWCDQKGSSYDVSISEAGSICLVTTRPSGEVINSDGLIRADTSKACRIVWGRVGSRMVYVLEKQTSRTLRWLSSGSGAPFDWERQQSENEERRERCGERRAQLRREFGERREKSRALKELLGVTKQQTHEEADSLKPPLSVKTKRFQVRDHVDVEKALQAQLAEETTVEDRLLEYLTSPMDTKTSVQLGTPAWGDSQHGVPDLTSMHFAACQWGMWNPVAHQYFAQIPVAGTAPQVFPNGFASSVESFRKVA